MQGCALPSLPTPSPLDAGDDTWAAPKGSGDGRHQRSQHSENEFRHTSLGSSGPTSVSAATVIARLCPASMPREAAAARAGTPVGNQGTNSTPCPVYAMPVPTTRVGPSTRHKYCRMQKLHSKRAVYGQQLCTFDGVAVFSRATFGSVLLFVVELVLGTQCC